MKNFYFAMIMKVQKSIDMVYYFLMTLIISTILTAKIIKLR